MRDEERVNKEPIHRRSQNFWYPAGGGFLENQPDGGGLSPTQLGILDGVVVDV